MTTPHTTDPKHQDMTNNLNPKEFKPYPNVSSNDVIIHLLKNNKLGLPIREHHNPPPTPNHIDFFNFNQVNYIIDKIGNVGEILQRYPTKIRYLNGEIKIENENNIYKRDEFEEVNDLNYEKYILQQLKSNSLIYDLIYYDDELARYDYSLGDLRKYKDIIIDIEIQYILIKNIRNIITIYVIGDLTTINEKFKDIGLGYLSYQDARDGGILTNLYPGALPKGWGSALLCLLLKIKNPKSIKLEALSEEAKAFYLRLGFISDTNKSNPLDLILTNTVLLKNYCLDHNIDLDSFSYDIKKWNNLYQDLNLADVIEMY